MASIAIVGVAIAVAVLGGVVVLHNLAYQGFFMGPHDHNSVSVGFGRPIPLEEAQARCQGPLALHLEPVWRPWSASAAFWVYGERHPVTEPTPTGRMLLIQPWAFRLPGEEGVMVTGGWYHRTAPFDAPPREGMVLIERHTLQFQEEDLPGTFLVLLRVGDGCGQAVVTFQP